MTERRRRVASLALVVLVVASAVVGPVAAQTATETATATDTGTATESGPAVDCSGLLESPEKMLFGFIGAVTGCDLSLGGGQVADDLETEDARETKVSLHSSLSTVKKQAETANDSRSNALEGAKSVARMEGKNAYVAALENDSTEANANAEATTEVEEYYSVREMQVLNQWETTVEEWMTARNHAESESGVSNAYVNFSVTVHGSDLTLTDKRGMTEASPGTFTLSNGTTVDVSRVRVDVGLYGNANLDDHAIVSPSTVNVSGVEYQEFDVDALRVQKPYQEYSGSGFDYLDTDKNPYALQLNRIESQNSAVKSEISTFVSGTYSDWQEGYINTTDLVDPYMGAREYSPADGYETWSLRSLTSMGLQSPTNMSQFGSMVIEDKTTGYVHQGVLMSGTTPNSTIEVNKTYDASNLAGLQFVAGQNETTELTGEFVVRGATNVTGGNLSAVEYNQVRYQTTNLAEYKAQMEELREEQAEINTRQDKLRDSIGGGGLFGGSVPPGVALGAIGVVVLVVLLGKES